MSVFNDGEQLGMGSALETLCGQAFGAGQIRMLGVYMQRSWVILLTTAAILVPIYVWSPPILELIGETTEISEAAGQLHTHTHISISCCETHMFDTCREVCSMDASAVVCLRSELSNPEIPTGSEESVCNGVGISSGFGAPRIF